MPVCRLCCPDFFVMSKEEDGVGGDAVRRLRIDNMAYPGNKNSLNFATHAPAATDPVWFTVDYKNRLLLTLDPQRTIRTHSLTLRPRGTPIALSGNVQTLALACDWRNEREYYVKKTQATITNNVPDVGLSTEDYEFEYRAVNYDGSGDQLIATDSGSTHAVTGFLASQVFWIRFSPLEGGQLYVSFRRAGLSPASPPDTDLFAYLKKMDVQTGGITTLVSLEDPTGSATGDAVIRGLAVSAKRQKLVWIESVTQTGGTVHYLKVGGLDGGGATTILETGLGTALPTQALRHVLVSEKEDRLYVYVFGSSPAAIMYVKRMDFDGSEETTIFDTGQAVDGKGPGWLGNGSYSSEAIALGCQREHAGAGYEGDG